MDLKNIVRDGVDWIQFIRHIKGTNEPSGSTGGGEFCDKPSGY
jgi:hypothetical protein